MSALAEQLRRYLRPRGVAALLVIAQVALVVGALSVPLSFAWLRQRAIQLGLQTLVSSSAALPALGPLSARPALIVLAYHNVQEHPSSRYSVTPRQFADQIRMLRVGGYSAASGEDILAALAGRPITGHKVLITFDDGARGIWTYADPILARYGFRAMAFIITGAVDTHQPYYVTWRELAAMHNSGRWDLESHTNQGHGTVPVTADGARGPFLASREWLAPAARAETMAEYTSRVGTDLARSVAAFVAHGLPAPRFLAFPFSARGHPSNDPRIPNLLRAIVSKQFVAEFNNDSSAGALTPTDLRDRLLPRIEVTGSTTALALHAKLRQAAPRTVAEANLRRATDWCCGASTPSVVVDSHGDLRLPGTKLTSWRIATYGPAEGEAWTSYLLTARVHGLTSPGTAAALLVGTQGRAGLRVVVERTSVRVVTTDPNGVTRELAWRTLSLATSHQVAVWLGPTGAEISVDGSAQMMVPVSAGLRAGSIGLGTFRTLSSQDVWFENVQLRPALGALVAAAPRTVAEANLRRATDWCCGWPTPSVVVDSHGDLRVPGTKLTSWRIATYGPAEGEAWTSYSLTARVHGLTSPGTAAALLVGTRGRAGLRVVVERTSLRVVTTDPSGITRELAWRTLSLATSHQVAVWVGPTGAEISVDGRAQMTVPASAGLRAGSIGLGTFLTLSSQDVWFENVQLRAL